MRFGTKFIKTVALMLALIFALAAASCVPETDVDILDAIPDLGSSSIDETSEEPSVAPTEEGYTASPVIAQHFNLTQTSVLIAGSCEKDALIEVVGTGGITASAKADGEKYVVEVEVGSKESVIIEVYATSEGKKRSVANTINAGYNAVAQHRVDGYATVLGKGFNFFLENTYADYQGKNLITKTLIDSFVKEINTRVTNLKKRGDAELIYVLIPNEISVYPELLTDDITRESNSTRFEQVKAAIEASNASVIDLTDALVAAKGAEGEEPLYPLYYDTYSLWSEYGAYVAYTEIMNYIAQKFPDAAPRGLDEFDIKTVDALGGDLAYFIGLDREYFGEKVVDFVPKFDLNIGDKTKEETKYVIGQLKQYAGDNDYRIYNAYYRSKLVSVDSSVIGADSKVYFYTERPTLPSAIIYRDETITPMIDFLAERFNNLLIDMVGNYSVNMSNAEKYAGTEGNSSVDYVFIMVSENNIGSILPVS